MTRPKIKWFLAMASFTLLHVASFFGFAFYTLVRYWDQKTTPIDPIGYTLVPLFLVGQPPNDALYFLVLFSNSIIWGAALGTLVAWLFGWLPVRQFSLRTLLIATTLVAVVLGLLAWATR